MKLITRELMQAKYLEQGQVPNSEPPCYDILWGPRAQAEICKMKIMEVWAKVNNTVPVSSSLDMKKL